MNLRLIMTRGNDSNGFEKIKSVTKVTDNIKEVYMEK